MAIDESDETFECYQRRLRKRHSLWNGDYLRAANSLTRAVTFLNAALPSRDSEVEAGVKEALRCVEVVRDDIDRKLNALGDSAYFNSLSKEERSAAEALRDKVLSQAD